MGTKALNTSRLLPLRNFTALLELQTFRK